MLRYLFLSLWAFLAAFAVSFIISYSLKNHVGLHETFTFISDYLRITVSNYGTKAPLIFIILYTFRSLVLFPASLMALMSVVLFGPIWGWIFTYIGENLSASLAYVAGKMLSHNTALVAKMNKYKFGKYITSNQFMSVFTLRLIPLIPFDVVNYGSGISQIKHAPYFLATATGTLPGLTAYIFLGYSLLNPQYLIFSIALIALLIGLRFIILKRNTKK